MSNTNQTRLRNSRLRLTPEVSLPDMTPVFESIGAEEAEALGVKQAWQAAVLESQAVKTIQPEFREAKASIANDADTSVTTRTAQPAPTASRSPETANRDTTPVAEVPQGRQAEAEDSTDREKVPEPVTEHDSQPAPAKRSSRWSKLSKPFANANVRSLMYYGTVLIAAIVTVVILERSDPAPSGDGLATNEPDSMAPPPLHEEPLRENARPVNVEPTGPAAPAESPQQDLLAMNQPQIESPEPVHEPVPGDASPGLAADDQDHEHAPPASSEMVHQEAPANQTESAIDPHAGQEVFDEPFQDRQEPQVDAIGVHGGPRPTFVEGHSSAYQYEDENRSTIVEQSQYSSVGQREPRSHSQLELNRSAQSRGGLSYPTTNPKTYLYPVDAIPQAIARLQQGSPR